MAQAITSKFTEQMVDILIDTHRAFGTMVILNPKRQYLIGLTKNLRLLFDTNSEIFPHIAIKKFTSPNTYFVHCDLVDKEQNLLNGDPSSVLARFDIRREAYEKVHYQTPQTYVLHDTSTGKYVDSLTILVRDEKGELFSFNDFRLKFRN